MTIERTVKFKLGGIERRCDVTLRTGLDIEEATGQGLFALARTVSSQNARLVTVAEILRVTLAGAKQEYTTDQVLADIERDGIAAAYVSATTILLKIITPPKNAAGKKPDAPQQALA